MSVKNARLKYSLKNLKFIRLQTRLGKAKRGMEITIHVYNLKLYKPLN